MRDIVLLLVFPILLFFVLRRPFIGSSLWLWSAMFFPNGWVWGIATSLRYNLIIAVTTVFSYLISRRKGQVCFGSVSVLILVFLLWTTISSAITLSIPDFVWFEWSVFFKIVLFYFICTFTLNTEHRINVFIWMILFSAAYFGASEGLKYLATFGGHKIEGIFGSRLKDRNELALSLNMILPLVVYLLAITKHKFLRLALVATVCFCIVAILGSYSRGGLLGLLVVAGYFYWVSKRKVLLTILIVIAGSLALSFMSDRWTDRMDTIGTMNEDTSFIGRVQAWKQAVLMANDNPFFGGGFKAGQNQQLWKQYEPEFSKFDHIIDTSGKSFEHAKAAHSIYFQVLGDHGYVGLILFLMILLTSYRNLSWLIKNAKNEHFRHLSQMLKVSLAAYCVGGAALSLPYFDLSFAFFAMITCMVTLEKSSKKLENKGVE